MEIQKLVMIKNYKKEEKQHPVFLNGQVESYNHFIIGQNSIPKQQIQGVLEVPDHHTQANEIVKIINKQIEIIEKKEWAEIQITSNSFDDVVNNIKKIRQYLLNYSKIYLSITAQFKDSNGRLNFSSNILKLANQSTLISKLNLKILGNITKEQSIRIIEALQSFPMLYNLDLNFIQSILNDQVAEGISSIISKLQNLHILKIFVNIEDFISKKLSRNSIITLNQACAKLKNLEIFQFPFRQEIKVRNGLPISNFEYFKASNSYQYSLQFFLPYMVEDIRIFKNQLEAQREYTTKVTFYEHQVTRYHTDFSYCEEIDYMEKLFLIYNLPYLTSFQTNLSFDFRNNSKDKIKCLIKQIQDIISIRLAQLQQIIVFNKYQSFLLQFNPNLTLVDLWIN